LSLFESTKQESRVAVKIRMKKMGRKHRPFFRICAVDARNPRDGRVLEELGTYDPMVGDADARALLKPDRIDYWLGVGAQPSDKVRTLIKKYGASGTHLEQQRAARERLALPRMVPDAGTPVYVPLAPGEAAAPAANSENGTAEATPEQTTSVSE
jgi:small subunit ribosomal protein S16